MRNDKIIKLDSINFMGKSKYISVLLEYKGIFTVLFYKGRRKEYVYRINTKCQYIRYNVRELT